MRTSRWVHGSTKLAEWRPEDVQLVELISEGRSNKEIADRLRVSESAVKKRIWRLSRGLCVSGRIALIRAAFEAGVLTLERTELPDHDG